MRKAIVLLALLVAGCAGDGPVTTAYKTYSACLAAKPAGQCANEKAQFDAATAYADVASRRMAANSGTYRPMPVPMPVIETYQPPQSTFRPGLICTTNSGTTICN